MQLWKEYPDCCDRGFERGATIFKQILVWSGCQPFSRWMGPLYEKSSVRLFPTETVLTRGWDFFFKSVQIFSLAWPFKPFARWMGPLYEKSSVRLFPTETVLAGGWGWEIFFWCKYFIAWPVLDIRCRGDLINQCELLEPKCRRRISNNNVILNTQL